MNKKRMIGLGADVLVLGTVLKVRSTKMNELKKLAVSTVIGVGIGAVQSVVEKKLIK